MFLYFLFIVLVRKCFWVALGAKFAEKERGRTHVWVIAIRLRKS